MSDSDLKQLADLSEEERKELLNWFQKTEHGEAELNALTNPPSRSGKRTMSEAMANELHGFLMSIMGKDSPYQFAGLKHLYLAYRRMQDKHDQFCEFMGEQEFKFFMRRWIIKNAPTWCERSATRRNKVRFIFPNGLISIQYSGFGKRQLSYHKDGKEILAISAIPLETAWNWQAYYNNQVLDDQPKENV